MGVVIGKNILDNLTTGMYIDAKVCFREYIQNACDQIDKAIKIGLLDKNENKGTVEIFLDKDKKYICIEDNATGVSNEEFRSSLGDIANSNKVVGEDKGFRGIGRLCGLAYCDTLIFSTSYTGQPIKSIMKCNAKLMRKMLFSSEKYTLEEVWSNVVSFEQDEECEEKHYFKVELLNVGETHKDLLDEQTIVNYLQFVAPVAYDNKFYLKSKIYEYARSIGYNIDEYKILVNGKQLFKNYSSKLKEESGKNVINYDEIRDLEFQPFYNNEKELVAWMWIGLCKFDKQIPKINNMRGIRLRCANIQIGDDETLQKRNLFKENRGNYYFIGEVFVVDKNLIPNSQRDYFNENENRNIFENKLKEYFYNSLTVIYYKANEIKNAIKDQNNYYQKMKDYSEKVKNGSFVDKDEQEKMKFSIDQAKEKANKGERILRKYKDKPLNPIIQKVQGYISESFDNKDVKNVEKEYSESQNKRDKENYISSGMSSLSKSERKLVSKIMSIITSEASPEIAQKIISRIQKEIK